MLISNMYHIYISHKHTSHPGTPSPFAPSFYLQKIGEFGGACGDMDAAVELQLKAVRSSTSPAVAKVVGDVEGWASWT